MFFNTFKYFKKGFYFLMEELRNGITNDKSKIKSSTYVRKTFFVFFKQNLMSCEFYNE